MSANLDTDETETATLIIPHLYNLILTVQPTMSGIPQAKKPCGQSNKESDIARSFGA